MSEQWVHTGKDGRTGEGAVVGGPAGCRTDGWAGCYTGGGGGREESG